MTDQTNNQPLDEQLDELAGYRPENDQGLGVMEESDVEHTGNFNNTDVYQGETDDSLDLEVDEESLDLLISSNMREGETNDVMQAVQEGLTYVPDIDPPVRSNNDSPDGDEVDVVNGFALDAAEPGNERGASLAEQVHVRLLHDSASAELAHMIRVRQLPGGVIELSGPIRDLTDEELLLSVAGEIEGVNEVISHLQLATG